MARIARLWAPAVLLAASLVLAPPTLRAQETREGDSFRAWILGQASWKITEVAGHRSSLIGGSLAFGLTPRTMVGGAGFQLSGSTSPDPAPERSGRRLDFGYAGVMVERLHALDPDWAATGTVLLGAGHGTVRNRDLGVELGADTFGVVELEGGVVWRRPSPFQASLGGGYRFTYGVQDLPGVTSADLRGFTLTLGVRLIGR